MNKNNVIDIDEFIELFRDKFYSLEQLCDYYGLHYNSIIRFVKHHGISREKQLLERIDKDEFCNYYLTHTFEDVKKHFRGIFTSEIRFLVSKFQLVKTKEDTLETRRITVNKRYSVDNVFQDEDIKKKIRKTNLEKYGNECAARSDYVKQRWKDSINEKYGSMSNYVGIRNERSRETCLDKYGVEYYSSTNEYIEKYRETLNNRYGVDNMSHIEGAQDKKRKTCLEKYGVEVSSQNADVIRKGQETRAARYGSVEESYRIVSEKRSLTRKLHPEITDAWREKVVKTNMNRYGVPYYCLTANCRNYRGSLSAPNINFANLLQKNDIMYTSEFVCGKYRYDFKIDDMLIEIDPFPTHNVDWGLYNNPVDKLYHRNKTLNAVEHGYKCIHIYDWIDFSDIIYLMRNCTLFVKDNSYCKEYIYNYKTRKLVNTKTDNCVSIFDDGFHVYFKEQKEL